MGDILTFDEAREYLKFSKSKLYMLVQKRQIPAAKIGRSWRFKKSQIDVWFRKKEIS